MKKTSYLYLAACIAGSFQVQAQDNQADVEKITVYGQSPLSFVSGLTEYSPASQTIDADALDVDNGNSLARILDNQLVSVSINDVQNNPFQADLQYRGFTASPLLGLPQGLAVYFNGTRFNEPFGDTVNWDLIPPTALESVTLVSGANPVFGQNTLGGALILNSKDGFSFPHNKVTVMGGDFGQQGMNGVTTLMLINTKKTAGATIHRVIFNKAWLTLPIKVKIQQPVLPWPLMITTSSVTALSRLI